MNGFEKLRLVFFPAILSSCLIILVSRADAQAPETTTAQAQVNVEGRTIDVDRDFGGNLEQAIAQAQNGDLVILGNRVYQTNGITIGKSIILSGQSETAIDGNGTDNPIITVTPDFSGGTIENIEITNGNMGIYGDNAKNITLNNLHVHNIGNSKVIREGQNNTGIELSHVDGLKLTNSLIENISRKAVGVGDSQDIFISDLTVRDINLEAEHAQSHDAGGVKFFNTNKATIQNSNFSRINGMNIWNDTTTGTAILNNNVENVGDVFKAPLFDPGVDISGIYNEKSVNSVVDGNRGTSVEDFATFDSTSFTIKTETVGDNQFEITESGTNDYWANEEAEKKVAITEDPDEANFSIFAEEYASGVRTTNNESEPIIERKDVSPTTNIDKQPSSSPVTRDSDSNQSQVTSAQPTLNQSSSSSSLESDSNQKEPSSVEETDLEEVTEVEPGEVAANIDRLAEQSGSGSKRSGAFNYGEALQKNFLFFEANRSGALPSDNRILWRSDSTTSDGSDIGKDLEGGYFDAGDHIKFVQPMAYSLAFLSWSGVDYRESYQELGQLDELLEAVKWGTDYLLKCHEFSGGSTSKFWVQVGNAEDHNNWIPPERVAPRPAYSISPDNPGTDAAAGAASALASASMLFQGVDDAYSDELLQNAIALFDFAETYKGKYSDSVPEANPFYTSWSGYEDELVLGAAWLYRATGDAAYLTKAENYFKDGIRHIGNYTYGADDHSYAGLALLSKESADPFFKEEFKNWASYWTEGTGGVDYSPGGLAVRTEWASVPLSMSSAYLAEWYVDFVEPNSAYSDFATKQVNYVLGDNPLNYSYLIGFGENYPLRPHHRGSAGSQPMDAGQEPNDNLLVGAIVGGPSSADDHEDRRDDWVTNEVGTGYNAPFAGAAIQQYENFGGSEVADPNQP